MSIRNPSEFGPHEKDIAYTTIAENLVAGKGYQGIGSTGNLPSKAFRPPLFPLILAGSYTVFGQENLWPLRVFAVLLGVLFCGSIYLVAEVLFSHRVALLAGILSSFHPSFVFYGTLIHADAVALSLFWISLALLFRSQTGAMRTVSGIVYGLSCLTRTMSLGFLPFLCLWDVWLRPKDRNFRGTLLFFVATIMMISPWLIRNRMVFDRWILSTDGSYTFWSANCDLADGGGGSPPVPAELVYWDESRLDQELWRRGFEYIKQHPMKTFRMSFVKLSNFWRLYPHTGALETTRGVQIISSLAYAPMFLLAAIGAWMSRRSWKSLSVFYFLVFYYTSFHTIFNVVMRRRLPIEPFLITLAAFALVQWFGSKRTTESSEPHDR